MACKSTAGFQSGSSMMSRLAPTMFRPTPPARDESRKARQPRRALKALTISTRAWMGVDPVSFSTGTPSLVQSSAQRSSDFVKPETITMPSSEAASRNHVSRASKRFSLAEAPAPLAAAHSASLTEARASRQSCMEPSAGASRRGADRPLPSWSSGSSCSSPTPRQPSLAPSPAPVEFRKSWGSTLQSCRSTARTPRCAPSRSGAAAGVALALATLQSAR
mmetsp:Transcript_34067/g.108330  ORF Transcript_34067/g.108330 Transcript_34067/m.108330 type:complete len:220 (-) Transcript_34067:648-1307(-)